MIYSLLIIILILIIFLFIFSSKNKIKNKEKTNALDIYSKTFGYDYDGNTHKAFLKCSQDFSRGENRADNSFIASEILQYNLGQEENARRLRNIALAEIAAQPINPDRFIEPEFIVDRAELIPEQDALMRIIIAGDRRQKEPGNFDRIVRSDPQNVHDTTVQDEMQMRYDRIKRSIHGGTFLSGLRESINSPGAHIVLDRIISNPAMIDKLSATDEDVLRAVWARINDPANAGRREDLIAALQHNLENCYNDGSIVCVTGRVNNILDSLTAIDVNPAISEPVVSTDILRKDIMQHVAQIINTLPDGEKKIYETGEDHAEFQQFAEKIKTRIDTEIRENFGQHSGSSLEKIILEAKSAI